MDNALVIDKSHALAGGREDLAGSLDKSVFGEKMGIIAKLFGCWHQNISRPFIKDNTSYRCCLECGARRQFNPETLETYGAYYFPPLDENAHHFSQA